MIMIFAGRRDDRCALHVAGHAGCAARGQDVVCAAVSAVVNTLPGEARVTCGRSGAAEVLFYAAVIGLAQMAAAYPDHIQMQTEGYFRAGQEEESA